MRSPAEALGDDFDGQEKIEEAVARLETMLTRVGQSLKSVTNTGKKDVAKTTVIKLLARIEDDLMIVRSGLAGSEPAPEASQAVQEAARSDPRVRG